MSQSLDYGYVFCSTILSLCSAWLGRNEQADCFSECGQGLTIKLLKVLCIQFEIALILVLQNVYQNLKSHTDHMQIASQCVS